MIVVASKCRPSGGRHVGIGLDVQSLAMPMDRVVAASAGPRGPILLGTTNSPKRYSGSLPHGDRKAQSPLRGDGIVLSRFGGLLRGGTTSAST